MNIGATSITDYGKYFQWGDTKGYTSNQVGEGEGKKCFGWKTYKYCNDTYRVIMTKYNDCDKETVLEPSDDAARANWGGNWRMPTKAEFQALGNAVNTAWTEDYQGSGVKGLVCTDRDDSSKVLFFPSANYCDGCELVSDTRGQYWSASLDNRDEDIHLAYCLTFDSEGSSSPNWAYSDSRYYGYVVRGVHI